MASTQLAIHQDEAPTIYSSAETWALATKMATSLAQSTIVPKDFQGNANNTLIALELANRLHTSPLMVMQNLYVVYGRPSWSAQYMIGMINGSGKYDFELQFDEKTDRNGKPFSCQCWTEKDGRKVTGPVIDMDMAKAEGWTDKNGSKWRTMPQIMLRYRAASFFGRMNCPELTMGIYSRDEIVEIGPEDYKDEPYRNVDEEVRKDISQKANAVVFEEAEVVETKTTPVQEEVPKEAAPVSKKNSTKQAKEESGGMPDWAR